LTTSVAPVSFSRQHAFDVTSLPIARRTDSEELCTSKVSNDAVYAL
jgi:hypothetical protein